MSEVVQSPVPPGYKPPAVFPQTSIALQIGAHHALHRLLWAAAWSPRTLRGLAFECPDMKVGGLALDADRVNTIDAHRVVAVSLHRHWAKGVRDA